MNHSAELGRSPSPNTALSPDPGLTDPGRGAGLSHLLGPF